MTQRSKQAAETRTGATVARPMWHQAVTCAHPTNSFYTHCTQLWRSHSAQAAYALPDARILLNGVHVALDAAMLQQAKQDNLDDIVALTGMHQC